MINTFIMKDAMWDNNYIARKVKQQKLIKRNKNIEYLIKKM